tara:strand:- start:23749 stop:24330 length:582 start_codon:yes stop_codon:yes gene_type:complete
MGMATNRPSHFYELTQERQSEFIGKFLRQLKQDFGIKRMYYPAVGEDRILETAFTLEELVYADVEIAESMGSVPVMIADLGSDPNDPRGTYEGNPFPNGHFDGVFYQDGHMSMHELMGVLETLRVNGVLVFSRKNCGQEVPIQVLEETKGLSRSDRPYIPPFYAVFQKTGPTPTAREILDIPGYDPMQYMHIG